MELINAYIESRKQFLINTQKEQNRSRPSPRSRLLEGLDRRYEEVTMHSTDAPTPPPLQTYADMARGGRGNSRLLSWTSSDSGDREPTPFGLRYEGQGDMTIDEYEKKIERDNKLYRSIVTILTCICSTCILAAAFYRITHL